MIGVKAFHCFHLGTETFEADDVSEVMGNLDRTLGSGHVLEPKGEPV
jgi:hypothetical protein